MQDTKVRKQTIQGKRKLADMNIDEFMKHGFDSDISSEDEPSPTKEKKESTELKIKSKTSKHKDQLSRLKAQDPEFYDFLQENDQELLEFNDSETDDELQTDDSDNEEKDDTTMLEVPPQQPATEDVKESEDLSDIDEEPSKDKAGTLVTLNMVKTWTKGLQNNSRESLKKIVQAFNCAVQDTLSENQNDNVMQPKYRVDDGGVFNSLVQTSLKYVIIVVQNHLGIDPNKNTNIRLSLTGKKWLQIQAIVKQYLKSILQLLRKLSEPTMLCVILRHTQLLCPYYAALPKISRAFIKRMARMWSSGEEHVRVMAFISLTKLFKLIPQTMTDFAVKQLYTNFVKNCKFTSASTLPVIIFMQNSLVEVFSQDPASTYQQGFVYIRQLAIHLRNALVQKKKDSYQSVYNWQFIHCLHLWCRVVSEVNTTMLEPLVYPLVQVTIGVIKLNPTQRYYPLRFHCIHFLNIVSRSTGKFIPVASFLLDILHATDFKKETKQSTAKTADFSSILKVSKTLLRTRSFQDSVVDHIIELLLEHLSTHAHSIGFPELVFPCVVKMKQFMKTSKNARLCKQLKQIIEKLEETSQEVTARRSIVSFCPKDIEEVDKWVKEYQKTPNAIVKFYNRWKSLKNHLPKQEIKDDGISEQEEVKLNPSKKQRTKSETKQTTKKKDLQENVEHKTLKLNDDVEEKEDIVEDFRFSDLED